MNTRKKIILLAIIPLLLFASAIVFAVRYQAITLAHQEHDLVQRSYMVSKERELKQYVALAMRAVTHLYNREGDEEQAKLEAKRILSTLNYGEDGYFFVYDRQGKCLMHARQPDMVGKNWWHLLDSNGLPVIQRLIEQAMDGGGSVRYLWVKPSSGKMAPKLGYVAILERWGWVIGTGIYLDDVEATLAGINQQSRESINNTMLLIAAIVIPMMLMIAAAGLLLNISESRVADAKLRVLMQRVVHSQEEERARLSRDLHDAIGQALVSIQLELEAGVVALDEGSDTPPAASLAFGRAKTQIADMFGDVRRISHNLRPSLLDDLGLAAALRHLAGEMSTQATGAVAFAASGCSDTLSEAAKTALFRIAQEALNNIRRHAGTCEASMTLICSKKRVRLIVADNGAGFDVEAIADHPKRGIGLRNIYERLHALGGALRLSSTAAGTIIIATVPKGKP